MTPDSTLEKILSILRPDGPIEDVRPLSAGGRRQTQRVRVAGEATPIVVQRRIDAHRNNPGGCEVEIEARLIDAIAARTSIPVAPLVGHGVTDGEAWLATRFVEGRDLHAAFADYPPSTQHALARRFGRSLAALHDAFAFEAAGRVVVAGDRLAVDDVTDSQEWLRTYAEGNVARLPRDFDSLRPALEAALADLPAAAATPRLFPWDLRPGNALVADASLAAVVDWEAPLSAPPALSLAKTEYLVADWYVSADRAADLRAALRAGYAAVRSPPVVAPGHRVAAVASAAVDSRGRVTNPGYPPVDRAAAVAFHRRAFSAALAESSG